MSQGVGIIGFMKTVAIDEAVTWLEKANADLEPELLTDPAAREMFAAFARAEKLASFGKTMLARRMNDAAAVAKVAGTSVGKAKASLEAGNALAQAPEVRTAFRRGGISLDQAAEIARAEVAKPGCASDLLDAAGTESFQVLREKSRKIVLEAAQKKGLAERQREARSARRYVDELGMVHVHLAWEPHVGTPLANRAETEAARLYREAKKAGEPEPFERYLADAYAAMLSDSGSTRRSSKPEMVILVSHEIAKRGWDEVKEGEICSIPGVGPISPEKAKEIANDAFLTGVFYDGKDLRHMKRWTRNTPVEVRLALQLGDPPEFDGLKCVDCGNRFRLEIDHVEPHIAGGPASVDNSDPRCRSCHKAKTIKDLRAGKFNGDTS